MFAIKANLDKLASSHTTSIGNINQLSAPFSTILLNGLIAPHSCTVQNINIIGVRVGILVPQLTPLHQAKVRQLQVSVVNQDSEESKKG